MPSAYWLSQRNADVVDKKYMAMRNQKELQSGQSGKFSRSHSGGISMRSALGFGAGDFFGGGQLALVTTYLALFWTRFCGMNISAAQGIIGASAMISAVSALLFGVLDDNLYRYEVGRRFGRRHLMLMIIAPSLLVGVLLWIPGLPMLLYACVYVLWVMLAQAFQACYNPLAGEMTKDFSQRTKLSTTRMFISTAAATFIPLAGSWALSCYGETKAIGYMAVAIISTVMFACAVGITWKTTWEMTPRQAGFEAYADGMVREGRLGARGWIRRLIRVLREYGTTLRIREFRKHLVIFLLVQTASDVFGQTFLFFVLYDWNRTAAFASLLLGCAVVSLPLMPLFGKAVVKLGVRRLYALAFVGMLLGVAWLALAWVLVDALPGSVWVVLAVAASLWFFAFKSLVGYLPWTVLVFIPDIDQIVTRRYRSATFSSVQSCLRQFGSGVVTIGVGLVLGAVGFDSSLPRQSYEASLGVAAVMLGFYVVAMIISWLVSSRLVINQETDLAVLHEIERLRSGKDKADVDESVRRTVERLTGLSYDECWQ